MYKLSVARLNIDIELHTDKHRVQRLKIIFITNHGSHTHTHTFITPWMAIKISYISV